MSTTTKPTVQFVKRTPLDEEYRSTYGYVGMILSTQ